MSAASPRTISADTLVALPRLSGISTARLVNELLTAARAEKKLPPFIVPDRDELTAVLEALQVELARRVSGEGEDTPRVGAADRIETQLRRYTRRLKDRHHGAGANGNGEAFDADAAYDAGYTLFQEATDEEEAADAPLIIAETRVDVPEATVSDAVMMLDLRNTTALLFRNSGTGAFNMVYRRGDGTIGWVEPNRAS